MKPAVQGISSAVAAEAALGAMLASAGVLGLVLIAAWARAPGGAGVFSEPIPARPRARPTVPGPDPAAVMDRNVFCSRCAPGGGQTAPEHGPAPADGLVRAELLATGLAGAGGVAPWAILRLSPGGPVRLVAAGSPVPGGEILRVEARALHYRHAGRDGVIRLGRGEAQAAPGSGDRSSSAARSPLAAAVATGLRRTGARSFEIDRRFLQRLLQDLGSAAGDGAAEPVSSQGRLDGFRLVRVAPGGLLAALGLAAGDVVQALDQRRIDGPDVVLEAWSRLPSASHLVVTVLRGGRPMSLDLAIR
jgi:hypothetical protein